jgi:hypothetical protein
VKNQKNYYTHSIGVILRIRRNYDKFSLILVEISPLVFNELRELCKCLLVLVPLLTAFISFEVWNMTQREKAGIDISKD